VDFVRRWSDKTEIGAGRFIGWLDVAASKFYVCLAKTRSTFEITKM